MTVKRFVAPDMRRALDLVREEMGPDAIILSSQRTAEGVEIITSLETDLPTRGADTRREFGQRFDEDVDSPLESDAAWEIQQGLETAAKQYQVNKPEPQQKTPFMSASRSAALAQEIENARHKMMAAKRAEQIKEQVEAKRAEIKRAEIKSTPRSAAQNSHQKQQPMQPQISQPSARPQQTSGQNNIAAQAAPVAVPTPAPASNTAPLASNPTPAAQQADFGGWEPEHYSAPEEAATLHLDQQMAGLAAQLQSREAEKAKQAEHINDERLSELHNQIADMRLLLEQQMWQMREGQTGAVRNATSLAGETLFRHLSRLGLPKNIVEPLLQVATQGKHLSVAWREALALLARQIQSPAQDVINSGGVFALVGPTGVGKTTSIAKLASRYVLEHGIGKVALITTDTYRVGAHDQLRALGRILNVPVRVVDRERPLASVVASLKNYPLILIDTAGFRQGDPLLKEQEAMLDSCPQVQRLLVLSTNSQVQNLKASAHAFGSKALAGCVLTKLDETASLGEALGVVISQKMPVLYMSDGQGIPEDIAVAAPHKLVARAVSIMKDQNDATASGAIEA